MMAMLLSPRFWAVLVAAAVLGFTHFTTYRIGKSAVRAEWNEQRLADSKRHAEELEAAITRQRTLQASIDRIKKENRHEVDRINRAYSAALDGLRDRPTERVNVCVSETPGAVVGCTGAGLAKRDAEFLAGYSRDAERLAAALRQCQAGYQTAREQLEAVGK